MLNRCRQCQYLIESDLISEAHSHLKPLISRPQAQIYQCDVCSSCFIFTDQGISLVLFNAEQQAQVKSVPAPL